MKLKTTKKNVHIAILSSFSVALSLLEGLLTPFLPLGIKPGLSNIATMLCAKWHGITASLFTVALKSFFVLITRGTVAFIMSASAGIVSAVCTAILLSKPRRRIGSVGISICGAVLHNICQLTVAYLIIGKSVLIFFPILLITGCGAGILTGIIFHLAVNLIEKHIKSSDINGENI